MLFEILVTLSTIGTTVLHLTQRTLIRDSITFEIDDGNLPDRSKDFLDDKATLLMIEIQMQTFIPPISIALLKYVFMGGSQDDFSSAKSTQMLQY